MNELDYRALAARVLRPRRRKMAEALACVAGMRSPRKAWEALLARGFIPDSWAFDPRRRFADYRSTFMCPGSQPLPPTVRDCAVLASDVQGIERAELAARELLTRLEPWRGFREDLVVWCVSPLSEHVKARRLPRPPTPFAVVFGALDHAWELAEPGTVPFADVKLPPKNAALDFASPLRFADRLSQCWEIAVSRGYAVPSAWDSADASRTSLREEVVGRRFGDLLNPAAPLLDLWGTGYATHLLNYAAPGPFYLLAPGFPVVPRARRGA